MKTVVLLLISGIMAAGCTSSEKNDKNRQSFEHLVDLVPPEKQQARENSKIYIDSVRVVSFDDAKALLVSGNFPDGCTHLGQVSHAFENGKLRLKLMAWRDPDMMCTQALTPFSYVYEKVPAEKIETISSVDINGSTFELE